MAPSTKVGLRSPYRSALRTTMALMLVSVRVRPVPSLSARLSIKPASVPASVKPLAASISAALRAPAQTRTSDTAPYNSARSPLVRSLEPTCSRAVGRLAAARPSIACAATCTPFT